MTPQELRDELRKEYYSDANFIKNKENRIDYIRFVESKLIEKIEQLNTEKSKYQNLLDHMAANFIPAERERKAFEAAREYKAAMFMHKTFEDYQKSIQP